jgi:hypothetical protein
MKKFGVHLAVAAILSLCAGCSGGTVLWSSEKEMESVRHWNVLANDVANRINNELMRRKRYTTSVHVRHSCGTPNNCGPSQTYPFDEGFHDLLTSQLVNFGVQTMVSPQKADLLIDYKVQVVYHAGQWQAWSWPKPGALVALAAGISVIRDAPWELVAGVAAIDVFRANYHDSGQYEVIITTSIAENDRYLMRFSDIYTIPNSTFWHYRKTTPAPEIRLTGPANATPAVQSQKTTSL